MAKLALFRPYIHNHVQYCSTVWYHCSAPNARCMETIWVRALNCVFSNHTASYESLLNKLVAKLALFRPYIHSHVQYCSTVWYHCSAPNARCMETIWERALNCVFSNHTASYESILNKLRLPSLEAGGQMNIQKFLMT